MTSSYWVFGPVPVPGPWCMCLVSLGAEMERWGSWGECKGRVREGTRGVGEGWG